MELMQYYNEFNFFENNYRLYIVAHNELIKVVNIYSKVNMQQFYNLLYNKISDCNVNWLREADLNHRPSGYESELFKSYN